MPKHTQAHKKNFGRKADRHELREASEKLAHVDREIEQERRTAERESAADRERIRALTKSELEKISQAGRAEIAAAERAGNQELRAIAARLATERAAALIRELFDEPAALLYQVWALLDTLDDAAAPESSVDSAVLVEQTDSLIQSVITCCDGPTESKIVMALIRFRDHATGRMDLGDSRSELLAGSRADVEELVNQYFREKLLGIPEVREFLTSLDD